MPNVDTVRRFCLALPHTTEALQWGDALVFKVGGKMFAVVSTEAIGPVCVSFKCDAESFAELVEREGIIPAPYLARAQWVGLESWDAMPARELNAALKKAHQIVLDGLPRKTRAALTA